MNNQDPNSETYFEPLDTEIKNNIPPHNLPKTPPKNTSKNGVPNNPQQTSEVNSGEIENPAYPQDLSKFSNDSIEGKIRDSLYAVVDPEISLNIIDMGLVYKIEFDKSDKKALLEVTLTTPACPLTQQIEMQIQQILMGVVDKVEVKWVWEPMWTVRNISQSGREQLIAIGFNI